MTHPYINQSTKVRTRVDFIDFFKIKNILSYMHFYYANFCDELLHFFRQEFRNKPRINYVV